MKDSVSAQFQIEGEYGGNRDTPAVSIERGQNGYERAKEALIEILGDGNVMLEWEEQGEPSRDNFGRLLAYVWYEDESGKRICANVEMVRMGFSEFWTKYRGEICGIV